MMNTSTDENDRPRDNDGDDPILNKLVKPQVKPGAKGAEEEDEEASKKVENTESTLLPGMPPLF